MHTYSGYENTVKATIEKTVEARQLQDTIFEVSIPMETVTEITEKGPKTYDRKLFPGYVLVKMILNKNTWHIIKDLRGVTGFVTPGGLEETEPLDDEEVYKLGIEKREVVVGFEVGDTVTVIDGPMYGSTGTVESIDVENESVTVSVSMFGRMTMIELLLDQVVAVSE